MIAVGWTLVYAGFPGFFELSASKVAPLDELSVAIAIVRAWMFLGKPLTWRVVAGGMLVVNGALTLTTT